MERAAREEEQRQRNQKRSNPRKQPHPVQGQPVEDEQRLRRVEASSDGEVGLPHPGHHLRRDEAEPGEVDVAREARVDVRGDERHREAQTGQPEKEVQHVADPPREKRHRLEHDREHGDEHDRRGHQQEILPDEQPGLERGLVADDEHAHRAEHEAGGERAEKREIPEQLGEQVFSSPHGRRGDDEAAP